MTVSIDIGSIDVGSLGLIRLGECTTLADDDPNASNALHYQDRVSPMPNRSARLEEGVLTVELPAISWTALQLVFAR